MKEIECLISGRVTGVMFRDFVRRKALSLTLAGTVQNQTEGRVIVIAQGDESVLHQLISYLEQGSFWSKVEKVEVAWREPAAAEKLSGFRILY